MNNRFILKLIKFTPVCLLLLYILGFMLFISNLPKYEDTKIKNDIEAIIVLTGGMSRISEGLKLLTNKYSNKLFISGLFTKSSIKNYKKTLSKFKHINHSSIHYDTIAKTTIENAEQVKKWISENNVKSIYLVTSYYHMPRAKYLIQLYIPDLKIIPHPVFPINFIKNQKNYTVRIVSLIFFEYNKYILSNLWFYFISLGKF